MPSVRSMLERVRKLEQGRKSPALAVFGTDEFQAEVLEGIAAGKLDARDWLGDTGQGGILAALQRWARERVWEIRA